MKRTFSDTAFFHSQVRVGKDRKAFVVNKFRTMKPNAHAEFENNPNVESAFSSHRDPRVTAVGGVLRKTKADEIPQLWNFFRGQLRVMGWRPLPRQKIRKLPKQIREAYFDMGPGLVGVIYALPKKERTVQNCQKLFLEFYALWKQNKLKAYSKYLPKVVLNIFR